MYKNLSSKSIK